MTDVIGDALALPRLEEIDDIAALVHEDVVYTTVMQICRYLDDPRGTFRKCRFWFWRRLIGECK